MFGIENNNNADRYIHSADKAKKVDEREYDLTSLHIKATVRTFEFEDGAKLIAENKESVVPEENVVYYCLKKRGKKEEKLIRPDMN
ncbi:MAG: hypothetical protein F6K24_12325 [Okeania sp. SIO2D1]|nr:hypothetical protein [Okeania sp. SIO2D1]